MTTHKAAASATGGWQRTSKCRPLGNVIIRNGVGGAFKRFFCAVDSSAVTCKKCQKLQEK